MKYYTNLNEAKFFFSIHNLVGRYSLKMKYFCWKGILVLLFYNFFILIFDMKILKHTINFKVWLYPDRKIRIQPKIPDPTGSATLVIAMQYLPTVGSGIRWTHYFFWIRIRIR